MGPVTRFRSAQELAAYVGLVPSTHSSGGKTHHGAIGRGSPWLKLIAKGFVLVCIREKQIDHQRTGSFAAQRLRCCAFHDGT